MPADRRSKIMQIMNIEGRINRTWLDATRGMGPDDEVYIAEWEYDLWDDDA